MSEREGGYSPKQEGVSEQPSVRHHFHEYVSDVDVAHGTATAELFVNGTAADQQDVLNRIDQIDSSSLKDVAYFRLAKHALESMNDLGLAESFVEKIENHDEQARCYVHLAIALINHDGNPTRADALIKKIDRDHHQYASYYHRARAK